MSDSHPAAGVLLTTGTDVLPDIDHPDGTISREFGCLTGAFAWLAEQLPGGPPDGTHSLVGIATFTTGASRRARSNCPRT